MKVFDALKTIWSSEDALFTIGIAVTLPFAFLYIAFPMLGFLLYVTDTRFVYYLISLGITNFLVVARIIYLTYFAKPEKTRKLKQKGGVSPNRRKFRQSIIQNGRLLGLILLITEYGTTLSRYPHARRTAGTTFYAQLCISTNTGRP